MKKILFVTDFYYEAKGRLYYEEEYDLFRQNISSKKTKYIQLFQWKRRYERQRLFNRIDKQRI